MINKIILMPIKMYGLDEKLNFYEQFSLSMPILSKNIVNNSGVKYVHRTIHVQVCIKLNHYGMTERDKAKTTRSGWMKEQVYFLKNLSTF